MNGKYQLEEKQPLSKVCIKGHASSIPAGPVIWTEGYTAWISSYKDYRLKMCNSALRATVCDLGYQRLCILCCLVCSTCARSTTVFFSLGRWCILGMHFGPFCQHYTCKGFHFGGKQTWRTTLLHPPESQVMDSTETKLCDHDEPRPVSDSTTFWDFDQNQNSAQPEFSWSRSFAGVSPLKSSHSRRLNLITQPEYKLSSNPNLAS